MLGISFSFLAIHNHLFLSSYSTPHRHAEVVAMNVSGPGKRQEILWSHSNVSLFAIVFSMSGMYLGITAYFLPVAVLNQA